MNKLAHRWIAAALITAGAVVVFASTTIVDVPGPIEASKPEFTFKFGTPWVLLAAGLAIAGGVIVKVRGGGKGKSVV